MFFIIGLQCTYSIPNLLFKDSFTPSPGSSCWDEFSTLNQVLVIASKLVGNPIFELISHEVYRNGWTSNVSGNRTKLLFLHRVPLLCQYVRLIWKHRQCGNYKLKWSTVHQSLSSSSLYIIIVIIITIIIIIIIITTVITITVTIIIIIIIIVIIITIIVIIIKSLKDWDLPFLNSVSLRIFFYSSFFHHSPHYSWHIQKTPKFQNK